MYWDSSEDNLNEADAASRKALELDPDLADAHASRGLALAMRKNFVEARTEFEMAIRLDPKLYEAYYFYARTSFQQGDLARAAQLYEQASHVNPDDYQAPSLLAPIYKSFGRAAEADATRRRALQLAEKHVELHPDDARRFTLGQASCANWESEREVSSGPIARWRPTQTKPPSFITSVASTLSPAKQKKPSSASKGRRRAETGIRLAQKDSDLDLYAVTSLQSLLR